MIIAISLSDSIILFDINILNKILLHIISIPLEEMRLIKSELIIEFLIK